MEEYYRVKMYQSHARIENLRWGGHKIIRIKPSYFPSVQRVKKFFGVNPYPIVRDVKILIDESDDMSVLCGDKEDAITHSVEENILTGQSCFYGYAGDVTNHYSHDTANYVCAVYRPYRGYHEENLEIQDIDREFDELVEKYYMI